jgi:transcription initiation factor TFIIE subunit beta
MSSYLERQKDSFTGGLAAAASKLGGGPKRTQAPPSPSPSITSTTSAAAATPKRVRDEPPAGTVYSQPANTGTGDSVLAQMTYVVEWLKGKDEPKTLHEILGHLSIQNRSEDQQAKFAEHIRRNARIQWLPDPSLSEQTWRSGTYAHKPTIPNVRNKTQLLGYLQKQQDAAGVSVKDLKDGWPDCEAAIDELEKDHRLLVVRTKKDNHARTIWSNDPTLVHHVDPEFQAMWLRVEVPSVDNIVQRLTAVGQKPASEDPRLKIQNQPKVEKKKKRQQRRPGKSTNTHMQHLLKEYPAK